MAVAYCLFHLSSHLHCSSALGLPNNLFISLKKEMKSEAAHCICPHTWICSYRLCPFCTTDNCIISEKGKLMTPRKWNATRLSYFSTIEIYLVHGYGGWKVQDWGATCVKGLPVHRNKVEGLTWPCVVHETAGGGWTQQIPQNLMITSYLSLLYPAALGIKFLTHEL